MLVYSLSEDATTKSKRGAKCITLAKVSPSALPLTRNLDTPVSSNTLPHITHQAGFRETFLPDGTF